MVVLKSFVCKEMAVLLVICVPRDGGPNFFMREDCGPSLLTLPIARRPPCLGPPEDPAVEGLADQFLVGPYGSSGPCVSSDPYGSSGPYGSFGPYASSGPYGSFGPYASSGPYGPWASPDPCGPCGSSGPSCGLPDIGPLASLVDGTESHQCDGGNKN